MPELECAGAVFRRFDGFLGKGQARAPTPAIGNMVTLTENVTRQYIVCKHRRRRHKDLMGDDQVLIHKPFVDLVLIGVAHKRVVAQRDEGLDRIRITAHHCPECRTWIRHVATHDDVGIGISPDFFCRVTEHILRSIRVGRMEI